MVLMMILNTTGGISVGPSTLGIIVYTIVSFLLTYLIVRFLGEKYIFRKIKLIYKVISDSKDSLEGVELHNSNSSSLEDVNSQAVMWAQDTAKELSSLKTLENYRKQYLGDVSHEMKTPLFSIQGYLLTLIEGGLADEKINIKYLKRAADNVNRLQAIVEDLELINELESGTKGLEYNTFDIRELTESIFNDMAFSAREKNIKLIFKSGADKAFKVYADKGKIRQVLINLISNSIKYGIQDGRTKVSFYDMEDRILVEVSDNGIGISEQDIKHVYDRFYRAEKSRSREVGGSGLGLAIVKHILEAHNQNMSLRSTDGKGSTFGFTLSKK